MKFLKENLLDHFERPEFRELYDSLTRREFSKGSFLCQPKIGENLIFIVAKGRARVYLSYEDKEFSLGILSKGDIYSTHTSAFVQALEDGEMLVADIRVFQRKMLDDPEVTKAMVGVLGGMLGNAFSIIKSLVFKDVSSRLIFLITNEARRAGEKGEDGGVVVHLDLSIEQIAGLVGSTRQTVSTLINNLARMGLLARLDRGKFLIPDLAALESYDGNEEL
ncbi:MAG: Crp/Fnr family transcriptional regulator [Spirochaetales bacterium]|nr:Crp/Fnr family transcriptional regulator [Spirochaetales bacterium]